MKNINAYIKALAIVVIIGAATVAYGHEMAVKAFSEINNGRRNVLGIQIKSEPSAIAELESRVLDRRKNAVKQGKSAVLPFLVNCIRYDVAEGNGYLCYYNSNQKMLYCVTSDTCVYFSYECEIGDADIGRDEGFSCARRAVYTAFVNSGPPVILSCDLIDESDKVMSFLLRTNKTGDGDISVTIRKDTGSVILYNALCSVGDEDK